MQTFLEHIYSLVQILSNEEISLMQTPLKYEHFSNTDTSLIKSFLQERNFSNTVSIFMF